MERPLSPAERVAWHMSAGASLNFCTIARVRGPFEESTLRAGLDAAQQRHCLLRVRVIAEEGLASQLVSDNVPPIPLRVASSEDWLAEAKEELVRPFDCKHGPLVRAVILHHEAELHSVLPTMHHMIADGMSGALLMRDVLEAAAGKQLSILTESGPMDWRLPDRERGLRIPPCTECWARLSSPRSAVIQGEREVLSYSLRRSICAPS